MTIMPDSPAAFTLTPGKLYTMCRSLRASRTNRYKKKFNWERVDLEKGSTHMLIGDSITTNSLGTRIHEIKLLVGKSEAVCWLLAGEFDLYLKEYNDKKNS